MGLAADKNLFRQRPAIYNERQNCRRTAQPDRRPVVARNSKLHELVVGGMHQNWSVAQSYGERIIAIVKPIVTAGQDDGELRPGDATTLTSCLLTFMHGHLDPILPRLPGARPTFDEMLHLCFGALRAATDRPNRDLHRSQADAEAYPRRVTSAVAS